MTDQISMTQPASDRPIVTSEISLAKMLATAREEGFQQGRRVERQDLLAEDERDDLRRICAAAREEGRQEGVWQALDILHDEGWIGASEQRIRDLVDALPAGGMRASSDG